MEHNPVRILLLLALPALLALSLPMHSADKKPALEKASPLSAQDLASPSPSTDDQTPVIRVSTSLVAVPVSVTNGDGKPVANLTLQDFIIEEDGRAQTVTQLGEPGEAPVELALLFDISGSVHPRFEFEQQAASKFLKEVIRPADFVSIFSVGLEPKLVRDRTANVGDAITGLLTIQPTRSATAFYDSVVAASKHLQKVAAPGTRRVQIVVSDGEDNFSEQNRLIDALREIQRADCLFYSINPGGPSIRLNKISLKGQEAMEALASQTGGAAFLPDKIEELTAIFARIANELQAQYLLGYYPSERQRDGKFRRIVVRVPNRPELRVRARQGYYPAAAG